MSEAETNYLLRIEGVNLSNVLDDTSEISIRRGAGIMLRTAVTKLIKQDGLKSLQKISTGASIGLFSFEAKFPDEIESLVSDYLNNTYPSLTFVVDTMAHGDNFTQAHEEVIAKNRYKQFQQMTLVAPERVMNPTEIGCCRMDQLHPIDEDKVKVKGNNNISASSRLRFKHGLELRQQFYAQELVQIDYTFTDDLTALSQQSSTQDFANLNNKMALIYLDGNSFGKIQKKLCITKNLLTAFDTKNQDYRRDFLRALLEKVSADPDMKNGNAIRLETLLWGGDEMILVVPAWKGMEIIQFFYEFSKEWKFENEELTYAGGIVFCNHKTPINQVIKTAEDLAESVKDSEGGREASYFDYVVLESVDYPTQSIESFWDIRYGKGTKKYIPSLLPQTFPSDLKERLDALPRGAIYDVGQQWVAHWNNPNRVHDRSLVQRIERFKLIMKSGDDYNALFDDVLPLLTKGIPSQDDDKQHENAAWIHLVELWDYLAPVNSKKGE